MKKKGVVTPFIIVGILILVIIGLFVALRNYTYAGGYVPSPLLPVVSYAKECVEQSADDGLFFLKSQGGYIYLPEQISKNPDSYINLGLKVPYWYYNYADRIPRLDDMEIELQKYIRKNSASCFNKFQNFKEFEVIGAENISDMDIDVSINLHDVSVKVTLPVQLTSSSAKSQRIYKFPAIVTKRETELGSMYKLAKTIMKAENKDAFLEGYVYDMVASSDYLPHEGVEITCQPRSWTTAKLEDNLKQVIMHNIHFLTFEDTRYTLIGEPYFDKIYHIDLKAGDFSNIQVNTIYNPEWPLNLEVLPNNDGVVKPIEYIPAKFLFNCIKIYHHKYSAEFPILFQLIADDNSEDSFFFATPVLMKRDEPNRYGEVSPWPDEVDRLGSEKYCSKDSSMSLYSVDKSGNIVVQPSVQKNRNVRLDIFAIDATKGYPAGVLKDAKISFHCVKFRCEMGSTDLPLTEEGYYLGDAPMLSTTFPYCFNGYIIAEKQGYLTARKKVTVKDDIDGSSVDVDMLPLKKMGIDVRIIEDHNNMLNERSMGKGEAAMIMISNRELNYEQTLFYSPDENLGSEIEEGIITKQLEDETAQDDAFNTLSMIAEDGLTYTVDIKLIDDEQVWGGASYNWTPSSGSVVTNNKVVFYVVKKDVLLPPTDPEGWMKLYDESQEKSAAYPPKMVYMWEPKETSKEK